MFRARVDTGTGVEAILEDDQPAAVTFDRGLGAETWEVVDAFPTGRDRSEEAAFSFARRVSLFPEVVAVSYALDGDVNLIWTFIRQRDKAVRRRVYLEELVLMDQFPGMTFDFNVVSLDETRPALLVADDLQGWLVFYRP